MVGSDRRISRGGVTLLLAAGAAVVVLIIGVLVAGGGDGDSESVAAGSTPPSSTLVGSSTSEALTRDDDTASATANNTASPSESAETSASPESDRESGATAIVPMDARFRRPFTVAATGDALPADWEGATLADDGSSPTRLESMDELPKSDRLSFLVEFCEDGPCSRGYAFLDANGAPGNELPDANRPFHIRHGFVNNTSEPLGPGFDLAVYIFSEVDEPGQPHSFGPTERYTTDYIVRGETDACGPNHATQDRAVTCEWFVHDFPDGLPEGRWVIWAVWEAPCWAWEDLGITECVDPDGLISLFSSGGSSPWT